MKQTIDTGASQNLLAIQVQLFNMANFDITKTMQVLAVYIEQRKSLAEQIIKSPNQEGLLIIDNLNRVINVIMATIPNAE